MKILDVDEALAELEGDINISYFLISWHDLKRV